MYVHSQTMVTYTTHLNHHNPIRNEAQDQKLLLYINLNKGLGSPEKNHLATVLLGIDAFQP